jgi:hypothetical protein
LKVAVGDRASTIGSCKDLSRSVPSFCSHLVAKLPSRAAERGHPRHLHLPPRADGTYYTTFTPSPIRTTCSASLCAATPQTIPFSFRYVPSSNGYAFTNAGGTSIVPLKNGNTMEFTFTGTSYLNVNGCKVWTDPVMIITLSATTYTGIAEDFYHQEACNGYSAADCECANDVEG